MTDEQPVCRKTMAAAAAGAPPAAQGLSAQQQQQQQQHTCEGCSAQTRQVVSVLTLSARDAIWPLLAAAELVDCPEASAAAIAKGQPSNGRHTEDRQQPVPVMDLAEELAQVAGPAAALEPHIVLVSHANPRHSTCNPFTAGLHCNCSLSWSRQG